MGLVCHGRARKRLILVSGCFSGFEILIVVIHSGGPHELSSRYEGFFWRDRDFDLRKKKLPQRLAGFADNY